MFKTKRAKREKRLLYSVTNQEKPLTPYNEKKRYILGLYVSPQGYILFLCSVFIRLRSYTFTFLHIYAFITLCRPP